MNSVIIAFPKMEVAQNVKKILSQSGYQVIAICTTGAAVLSHIEDLDSGIIVCGSRFVDMMYSEIYECLPEGFQMLLIASASVVFEREIPNLVCLSMPLKVRELLETLEMMDYSVTRYKKKKRRKPKVRSEEEKQIIEKAKIILMNRNGLTEEEAHHYIQKKSMDNGTGLVDVSHMIINLFNGE